MPINAKPEFFKAQSKYLRANTREEKLIALQEMLSTSPSHKGGETLRAEIRAKIAKLTRQTEAKAARNVQTISKEGDVQICLIGFTQSGKSTLLSKLTNAKPHISNRPYTTTKPQVGAADWKGVKFQIVEIPSTFESYIMNIAQNSDGIIFVFDSERSIDDQRRELKSLVERFRLSGKPVIEVIPKKVINGERIFESVWKRLDLIRIYTKEPDKRPEKRALVLWKGANVRNAADHVHKDFVKFFKFARIWGSSKHNGEKVGLYYKLSDGDIVEIHTIS